MLCLKMPDPYEFLPENGRNVNVNLSTSTSASSTALLSNVRAQRLQREQQRALERSAIILQKIWKGRSESAKFSLELVRRLEDGQVIGTEARGRALVVLFRPGWVPAGLMAHRNDLLARWFDEGE